MTKSDDVDELSDSNGSTGLGIFRDVNLNLDGEAPLPRRLAEVVSWNLLLEIVRRHPDRFWLRVTHPIEGLPYDCLQLCPLDDPTGYPFLEVNRTGTDARWSCEPSDPESVTPWTTSMADRHEAEAWAAEMSVIWSGGGPRLFETPSPNRRWLLERERDLGLEPPRRLPASTPSSLALRWIAKFLSVNVGSEQPWYAYTGGHDLTERLADLHANHREWQAQHVHEWQKQWIWLLIYGGEDRARIALSAQGDLWTTDRHFKLHSLHQSGRPITSLLVRTAPHELP